MASCKCGLLGEQGFCCVSHSGASGLVTLVSFIISDIAHMVFEWFHFIPCVFLKVKTPLMVTLNNSLNNDQLNPRKKSGQMSCS